jgi:GAF domain-containing protein
MTGPEQDECNLDTGSDEAVQALDQQSFQALLFNSFLNQQRRTRGSLTGVRRLAGILELLRDLPGATNEPQLLNLVATRAVEITGATGVAIALSHGGAMVCCASSGATVPDLGMRFSQEAGLSGECVRSGETLVCDDADNDPRVNREASRSLRVRSMILTPLRQNDGVVGVLEMFASQAHAFDSEDVHTLELLATLLMFGRSYLAERELRKHLEAERGAVLQVLEQITPALETVLQNQQRVGGSERRGDYAEWDRSAIDLSRSGIQALARSLAAYTLRYKEQDRKRVAP